MKNLALIIISSLSFIGQTIAQSHKIVPYTAAYIVDSSAQKVGVDIEAFYLPEGGTYLFPTDDVEKIRLYELSWKLRVDRLHVEVKTQTEWPILKYFKSEATYVIPINYGLTALGGLSYSAYRERPINPYPNGHTDLFEASAGVSYHYEYVYITAEYTYGWYIAERIHIINHTINHYETEVWKNDLESISLNIEVQPKMIIWCTANIRMYLNSPALEMSTEIMPRIGHTNLNLGVKFEFKKDISNVATATYGLGARYTIN